MSDSYYRDHWLNIEAERFDRYTKMFGWSEASRPLLEPAGISAGEVVVDLGCGPGFTAIEMCGWVGATGHVHGVELNREFVEFGQAMAAERGLSDRITFHHVDSGELPFADATIDCVVAKNVLVYVDDLKEAFEEGYRVLRPGGRYHAVDGDWGLALAEPVPEKQWRALVDAASIAFRMPTVGRRIYGAARSAGFPEAEVAVLSRPDTTGRLLPMVRNLCGYARKSGALSEAEIDSVLAICERAAAEKELLILNPQFLVTARK